MEISPLAGKIAPESILIDPKEVVEAYYRNIPDPAKDGQRVSFGTSGHRGSSLDTSFNEGHILAISQAICEFRKNHQINGPLFLGIDTHILSKPALQTALEVFAANQIQVCIAKDGGYTPTPVISHAILRYNQGRIKELADGVVITPSHNPPREGGFKYNATNGGPADLEITKWIESRSNQLLENQKGIRRTAWRKAPHIHLHDFLDSYVTDLHSVIDMEAIRRADLSLAVDPLGGAGLAYWKTIQKQYGLNLTIVNEQIDPTFRFMTVDWDGRIRMDPSSSYAMQNLIHLKEKFDLAFASDTDHDRHGIVTKNFGLLPSNHYLSAAIFYLFGQRANWKGDAKIGKTVVSTALINRIAAKVKRSVYEVPVGFKWFAEGLFQGTLGFAGEESAGASFLRKDGTVWTTDKDGIIASLLSAEMKAITGKDPGEIYQELTQELGAPFFQRREVHATAEQRKKLQKISSQKIACIDFAGEKVESILTAAPGNGAPFGGIKLITKNGWFAVRSSGTEDVYKIYAESFLGEKHLDRILQDAERFVSGLL